MRILLKHIQYRVGLSSSALDRAHLASSTCDPDHRTSTVSEQLRSRVRSLNQSIDPTLAPSRKRSVIPCAGLSCSRIPSLVPHPSLKGDFPADSPVNRPSPRESSDKRRAAESSRYTMRHPRLEGSGRASLYLCTSLRRSCASGFHAARAQRVRAGRRSALRATSQRRASLPAKRLGP